jgi:hypothetical protein
VARGGGLWAGSQCRDVRVAKGLMALPDALPQNRFESVEERVLGFCVEERCGFVPGMAQVPQTSFLPVRRGDVLAQRPSPGQQLRKNCWGGGIPPPAPPPAPLRGALAGLRPALKTPKQEGGGYPHPLPRERGFQWPQQRIDAPPRLLFMCVLGPLFFR